MHGNGVEEAASLEQYSMDLKFRPYSLCQHRNRNTNKTEHNLGRANKQTNLDSISCVKRKIQNRWKKQRVAT